MNHSLLIIKPDAVESNYIGGILKMVEESGLQIKAQKMVRLSIDRASSFYEEHKERSFFDSLVSYMSSGAVVVCIVGNDHDAVVKLRELIGATDPQKAVDGSIRKLYGKSIEYNAVHASDSQKSAEREIGFFFTESEILR